MWCNLCHYGSEFMKPNKDYKCPNCKWGKIVVEKSPFPETPKKTIGKKKNKRVNDESTILH